MNTNWQQENEEAGAHREDPNFPTKLKESVEKFQVCWEVLPDRYPLKNEIRQIGYVLELTGTHEAGVEHPSPACVHCRHIWRALEGIAHWIIPKEYRETECDVAAFDQSIQYNPDRTFRPEVSLRIRLIHRSGFDRPVDGCEVRCLNEMKDKLSEIGARDRGTLTQVETRLKAVGSRSASP
jgi:hypothetical protein